MILLLGLGAALTPLSARATDYSAGKSVSAATNAPAVNVSQVREKLLQQKIHDSTFKRLNSFQDSLDGVMAVPRSDQPNLTPAQARKLKEAMEREKYWMFADPGDEKKSDDETADDSAADPAGRNLDSGTPRILQKYFDRHSGQSAGTNGSAGRSRTTDQLNVRDLKEVSQPAGHGEIKTSATSVKNAIARLFEPTYSSEPEVKAGGGIFGDVFGGASAPAPARNLALEQHAKDFQAMLSAPSAPVAAPSANIGSPFGSQLPMPNVAAGNFNASGAFAAPGAPSRFSGPSAFSSGESQSAAAPPVESGGAFQPISFPRPKF